MALGGWGPSQRRLSFVFSESGALRRCASETVMPPNFRFPRVVDRLAEAALPAQFLDRQLRIGQAQKGNALFLGVALVQRRDLLVAVNGLEIDSLQISGGHRNPCIAAQSRA